MRSTGKLIALLLALTIGASWLMGNRAVRAQEEATHNAAIPSYAPTIENIMDLLSRSRFDEALANIDYFKDQPDAKEAMRTRLIRLNTSQHHNYGFDIVAAQRFSPRMQTVTVLSYFDVQPIEFTFDLYHPEMRDDVAWSIAGFRMHENVVEDMKDVPVDYHPTVR
jgi:hypothetical protein